MDNELIEAISKVKKNNKESNFLEEHIFIANCLQVGFKIDDLKQMEYKDVAKILLSFMLEEKNQEIASQSDASQSDIDNFLR